MAQFLFLCRPGFEPECAAEAAEGLGPGAAAVHDRPRGGWVLLEAAQVEGPLPDLVFARQGFRVAGRRAPPQVPLRPSGPSAWLGAGIGEVSEVLGEAPDSDEGRPLWPAAEGLAREARNALDAAGRLRSGSGRPRLHVFLPHAGEVVLGLSDPREGAPWPMGIPRLRLSREAPSRSALKLEEALLRFLPPGERERRLRPGMRAVDLGAAPGGWTWELARRGLVVTAVDNGPLRPDLLDLGLVRHLRADGFTYRPARAVDWMVCDMAAPPGRAAHLVGSWAAGGLCRESIFNLKLPMKRRLSELRRCEGVLRRRAEEAGARYELRFKHLYHDREEVTGHLRILASRPPSGRDAPRGGRRERPGGPRGGRRRREGRGRRRR